MVKSIKVGNVTIGADGPFVLIAGPCVIEEEAATIELAGRLKTIADDAGVPFIFKASYDKANRTSVNAFRGPGIKKGLEILSAVGERYGVPQIGRAHV